MYKHVCTCLDLYCRSLLHMYTALQTFFLDRKTCIFQMMPKSVKPMKFWSLPAVPQCSAHAHNAFFATFEVAGICDTGDQWARLSFKLSSFSTAAFFLKAEYSWLKDFNTFTVRWVLIFTLFFYSFLHRLFLVLLSHASYVVTLITGIYV